MAPPGKKLEEALIDGACKVFATDGQNISVNSVRKQVEEDLALSEGFFTEGMWKQKSKEIIREYAGKLLDGWLPAAKNEKNGTKRSSADVEGSPDPKRQKKASEAKSTMKASGSDEGSAMSDLSDAEEKPKSKTNAKKPQSGSALQGDSTRASPAPDHKRKRTSEEGRSSSKLSSLGPESDDGAPPVQEEDEYSDVIDEPPKTTRKQKKKSDSKSRSESKEKVKKAPKKVSTNTPDDPQEAEIKKLQSQLLKCGVRKLWHNELKQHGDDSRAKIRHLKKMLSDVGMDGRFSEAKAREIKESRELLADVEATQEMNALWGMNEGRASRSKAGQRSMKVDSESDDDADTGDAGAHTSVGGRGDEDAPEEDEIAVGRRRARADLAFLGDSSDSE